MADKKLSAIVPEVTQLGDAHRLYVSAAGVDSYMDGLTFRRTSMGGIANAMEYGATGLGVVDDSAAIQAAINTGACYLPPGKYLLNTGLTLTSNQRLIGAATGNTSGTAGSTLVLASGIVGITCDSGDWSIENLCISYKVLDYSQTGIALIGNTGADSPQNGHVRNVYIRAMAVGISLQGMCYFNSFTAFVVHSCTMGIILTTTPSASVAPGNYSHPASNYFSNFDVTGPLVAGTVGISISGVTNSFTAFNVDYRAIGIQQTHGSNNWLRDFYMEHNTQDVEVLAGYLDVNGKGSGGVAIRAGRMQVETATAVGTATGNGNVLVTVTSADLAGSPKLYTVAILLNDTPVMWAAKVRTALYADAALQALYRVSGAIATADVVLTRLEPADNDATLNIALANDPGADPGITAAAASASTTAGVDATHGACQDTSTICTGNVTADGTVKATVTYAALPGSPLSVFTGVEAAGRTPAQWGIDLAAALVANAAISALFGVNITGSTILLVRKTPYPLDRTFDLQIENGTSAGVTTTNGSLDYYNGGGGVTSMRGYAKTQATPPLGLPLYKLRALYPFREDTGVTVNDRSGNALHATATAGSTWVKGLNASALRLARLSAGGTEQELSFPTNVVNFAQNWSVAICWKPVFFPITTAKRFHYLRITGAAAGNYIYLVAGGTTLPSTTHACYWNGGSISGNLVKPLNTDAWSWTILSVDNVRGRIAMMDAGIGDGYNEFVFSNVGVLDAAITSVIVNPTDTTGGDYQVKIMDVAMVAFWQRALNAEDVLPLVNNGPAMAVLNL